MRTLQGMAGRDCPRTRDISRDINPGGRRATPAGRGPTRDISRDITPAGRGPRAAGRGRMKRPTQSETRFVVKLKGVRPHSCYQTCAISCP
jgi:hypothetical protein